MAACESGTTILDLSPDAWVAIGDRLACDALAQASAACKGLNQLVSHNHSLWSSKFNHSWPETFRNLSAVHDWPGLYKQSVLAACQVRCCWCCLAAFALEATCHHARCQCLCKCFISCKCWSLAQVQQLQQLHDAWLQSAVHGCDPSH
jgi:hypothetical protein